MKISLTILLLIAILPNAFSQHSHLTVSNEFKIAEKDYKNQTVSHAIYHDNCFYTVSNSGIGMAKWLFTRLYDVKFSLTVGKYDKNMQLIKEIQVNNGDKKFGPLIPEIILFNNKLVLAYFQSKNNSSFTLYLSAINQTDLSLDAPQEICTIQQEDVGISKIEEVIKGGLVYFVISNDNSSLMVVCKSSPNKAQSFILDNKLKQLNQYNTSINNPDFNIPSAVLTNDQKVCLITTSKEETHIIAFTPDGKKIDAKFNVSENFNPSKTNVKLSKDGNTVYVFATTSVSGESDEHCNGLLLSQLDLNTLKLSKSLQYEFSPEFLQNVSSKGGGGKHKKEFYMNNFNPQLIEFDNGDIAIVGSPEATSRDISMSALNMNNQSHMNATTTYTSGPLISFYPNKAGNKFDYVLIPREIKITKIQQSGSGAIQIVQSPSVSHTTAGYIAKKMHNDLIFIYNDNEDNINTSENDKLVVTKKAGDLSLAEAYISADKKLVYKKQIGDVDQKRAAFYLGNVIPTSTTYLIFPIGKEGLGFNAMKTFYTNWCFLEINE